MTVIAVLADLHGNLPALEAVLADLAQFQVEQIVVAGDVINWGPWSAEVAARVVAAGWPVIRGNNEYYLLDYQTPRAPAAWSDPREWSLLPWLKQQMPAGLHTAIAAWPDTLKLCYPDAPPVRVVHGSPRSNTEGFYPITPESQMVEMLAGVAEPYVVAAHTHLPLDCTVWDGHGRHWRVLNPGALAVPLDGRHVTRYLLLRGTPEGWQPTWRELPFDPAPVLAEFERRGLVEQCGVVGELVMEEYRQARVVVLAFMNWRRQHHPGTPLSLALLDEFLTLDPRPYLPEAYRWGEGYPPHPPNPLLPPKAGEKGE